MTLKDQLDTLLDATAFDSTGAKIGAVRQVYVDDASGKITFATVSTGIFSSDAIVPLHGARLLDDELHLDHTRSVIRDSPRPDHTEDALAPDQEVKLLEYYGIEASARGHVAAPSRPESKAQGGDAPTEKAPRTSAPEKPEVKKSGAKKSEKKPAKAEGGTEGATDRKKTDKKTTTTSSSKPEVGETREPAKPGAGGPKGEGGTATSSDRG